MDRGQWSQIVGVVFSFPRPVTTGLSFLSLFCVAYLSAIHLLADI